jgi:hypothetical protein
MIAIEDLVRLPQVGVEVGRHPFRPAGQQRAGVREHQRVVVDVDHAGLRRDGLGDLVRVGRGGQPGADVEELADPGRIGQVVHAAAEERPVGPGGLPDPGEGLDRLLARHPVGGEVVLPAQPVVVDAGDVRHAGVEPWIIGRLSGVRRLPSCHRGSVLPPGLA